MVNRFQRRLVAIRRHGDTLNVRAWATALAIPAVVTQEGVVMTADGIPVTGIHDVRIPPIRYPGCGAPVLR